jgi:hypothetical protein
MSNRKNEICVRCRSHIEPQESAVGISLFAQTLGMGKRKASKSERIYLCPQCAVVTAMGDEPPKGQPLNVAAYRIIRNLVGSDPAVCGKAWEELSHSILPSRTLPEAEILPPARSLKAAS